MKPESQRIAIAEACGWHYLDHEYTRADMTTYRAGMWYLKGSARCGYLPDYLNDLNAMHEAEATLGRDGESYEYWKKVCEVCHVCWDGNVQWVAIFATAAQRAEAFLRTLGKWTA